MTFNITTVNLAGFDLNLLLVFDAVMAERHVSRAGRRLGLSQPAVSNALNRLRHRLKDELFVRGPEGMRPTPRAEELAEPVRQALSAIQGALDNVDFDPKTARRTIRIATLDYLVAVLMPELLCRLRLEAPGIDLRILPIVGNSYDLLDAQDADFAIAAFGTLPNRFAKQVLLRDRYVCVMRPEHPLAESELSLEALSEAKHLLISPRGDDRGFLDETLAAAGLTRRVVMTTNTFATAAALVAASDLIVTVIGRVAERYARPLGLAIKPYPFDVPEAYTRADLIWHRRLGQHPAYSWFRQFLAKVAAEL